MDWIRRNWPDLLIGLALLAVIAGIIATLLNGGSFLPGRTSAPTPPAATTPADRPNTAAPTDSQADATEPSTTDGADGTPAETGTETGTEANPATTDIPVIPSNSEGATDNTAAENTTVEDTATDDATPVVESASTAPNATATGSEASAPVVSSPTDTSTAPSAVTASEVESSYRIVVGSFGNPDNALRRAQDFEAANLPAFTAIQGDLNLVLVGPFATRAEADSALSRIQNEGLEANPRLFEPTASGTETPEGANTAATTGTTTVTSTPAPPTGSSTSGASFLQTGAYGSSASAQPQRERLEGLGFSVSEVQEGSFVKLLVGPFSADELPGAQSRLSDQGIDYFVRSN